MPHVPRRPRPDCLTEKAARYALLAFVLDLRGGRRKKLLGLESSVDGRPRKFEVATRNLGVMIARDIGLVAARNASVMSVATRSW